MRTLVENLQIRRGDDYKYHIVLIDQSSGLPIDLSEASAVEFMVKGSVSDADDAAVISLAIGSGITLQTYTDTNGTDYADSIAVVVITNIQSALLTANSYQYDFVYNNVAGERYTAITGTITPLSQVNQGN